MNFKPIRPAQEAIAHDPMTQVNQKKKKTKQNKRKLSSKPNGESERRRKKKKKKGNREAVRRDREIVSPDADATPSSSSSRRRDTTRESTQYGSTHSDAAIITRESQLSPPPTRAPSCRRHRLLEPSQPPSLKSWISEPSHCKRMRLRSTINPRRRKKMGPNKFLGANVLTSEFDIGIRGLGKKVTVCGNGLDDTKSINGKKPEVLRKRNFGNMQKYLQSTPVRVEEMRVKRTDAEQCMSLHMLPENLREQIRRYEQYKWQESRGVEEENLVRNFPKDLRRDIK